MKTNRGISREKAMTILYQIFLYEKNKINYTVSEVINEFLDDLDVEERKKIDIDFLNELVNSVLSNIKEIDNNINKYLENWTLERLGLTDQAILRMGIYELVYTDTPEVVAINEAVELAKEYSDEKVKNMINAVLDKIYHGDNKDE